MSRKRDRVRSRVDELPPIAQETVRRMLADVNYTYQDIVDELAKDGHEISRSSIARYASRSNAAAARLKDAQEQTAVLINVVRENQDIEATELATAILTDGLIRRLASAEEEYDEMPLDKAGRLLVQLQRSTVYKERWLKERHRTIEAVKAGVLNRLRDQIHDNPELLRQITALVHDAADEEEGREQR